MIIERIVIDEFGALKDVTLTADQRLNVIEGGNESGKTTIAAFIRYMLYGFEDKARGASEQKKRLSQQHKRAAGEMTFSCKHGRLLLSRETREVSGHVENSVRLFSLDSEAPLSIDCSVGEYVLGIDASVYDEIASFARDTSLQASGARSAITELILTQNAHAEKREATERLASARLALEGASGILPELEREREKAEKALARARASSNEMATLAATLTQTREKKAEAELELEKLHALDDAYKHLLIIRRYDNLHTLEEQSVKAHKHLEDFKQKNAYNGFLPNEEYLESITEKRVLIADAA